VEIDKSLQEVWNWKEQIYQETKHMSLENIVKKIKENALQLKEKYGLNLKVIK
jgi:uncharacterized protein YeaC (DUF1315 family)